jgi:uncharacterized Zn finger protein
VRNGSVLDLDIMPGKLSALVAGSELYRIEIDIARLPAKDWKELVAACAGKIASLIGLLRGELSADVLTVLTRRERGLFPSSKQITMRCSCPDHAGLCKHLAAVLYGVGAHLDHHPELLFTLRQVDQTELVKSASKVDLTRLAAGTGKSSRTRLATPDLGAVFNIDLKKKPRR